jgi:TonB-dependent Receptor Plug Domain
MKLPPVLSRKLSPFLLVPALAALALSSLHAQATATRPADPAPTPTPAPKVGENGAIVLSPFNVDSSKDTGYYAENTLAGSRLNTSLTDLAASITVVTKQQMDDTASLDINDVFRYEANTEGSGSYTPSITDRGTAKDAVAGYTFGNDGTTTTNAQSNRIRGLSSPDAAINYFPSNSRVPFDSYNTQSVEISRGPNSLLFGLGSPSGIVNQTAAQAALNRNSNEVTLRTDGYGSFRTSLSLNRSLLKDKLAVYVAALYNNAQFQRKPSYELTRRQYAAVTYKPFPDTVIRAFAENYKDNADRPNFITPRDFVTPWRTAGRPVYDPITRVATVLDTGRQTNPLVFSTLSPGYTAAGNNIVGTGGLTTATSVNFLPGITNDDISRPVEYIDNGVVGAFFQRQPGFYAPAQTNPATATPSAASLGYVPQDPRYAVLDRMWTVSNSLPIPTGPTINGKTYTYATWQFPGVTNKAIYDWTKYNILQANFSELHASNYSAEIEQQILPNLFFNAGWFRQDIDSSENGTLSQLTGATLFVDTNVNYPNGQKNPYFGKPFVSDVGADTFYHPETDDNYRAMLAYDLDLPKYGNFLKWFGKHRILGLWSENDIKQKTERWRMTFTGADADGTLRYLPNFAASPTSALWSTPNLARHFFLSNAASTSQGTVTQGSGYYGNKGWNSPLTTGITVWNYTTGQYQTDQVTEQIAFADNGSFVQQREVKSTNIAVQSNFLEDRLVTTLGWRHDDYRARKTTTGIIARVDGTQVAPALAAGDIYHTSNGYADYNLVMNRWNRWDKLSGQTRTLGGAFRPLKGWGFIPRTVGADSPLSSFLQNLTLYYNESDNFNPPAAFQTDYFGKPLPKPTGTDREIGVGFSMLNNKLVARINWFTTKNNNERTAAASTLLTRLAYGDTTLMIPWASAVVRLRHGADTTVSGWNSETVNPINSNPALLQEVYNFLKLPVNYYSGVSPAGTQDSVSKGAELQLTYNPTRNWTMKMTGARQAVVYSNVAPQYDAWLAVRMPVWLAATAPEIQDFTDSSGAAYSLKNFWTASGYSGNTNPNDPGGNTSTQAYFNNTVVSQVALAKALEGAVAPDQRKYRMSYLTNYVFTDGKLKGFSVGGNERWESKSAIGYFGKVGDPTQPLNINLSDVTRPIFDSGNYYTDLWVAYSRKVFHDKIRWKLQLNCNNATESGHLQPIAVNFDGSPYAYRIIDSRQFLLTSTFSF